MTNPIILYNVGVQPKGERKKMGKKEIRDKHIGLLVEPRMQKELTKIAAGKYMTLSTYIYSVLKEHLKRKENDPRV